MNPCENGGSCSVSETNYICQCKPGYKNQYCTQDPCKSSPCQNGATCSVSKEGSIICTCGPSYFGKFCEKGGEYYNSFSTTEFRY